jgi:ribosomal protein S18 acetylase RimI-like enzyme
VTRNIPIGQLGPADLDAYFQLRLRGLAEHPEAFGQSHAEALAKGAAQHEAMLEGKAAAEGNFILGASLPANGPLVGTIAMVRSSGERKQHKASVVGMYVVPEASGQGVGRALLEALLARAARIDGVRQLELIVTSTNVAARGLYESLGFVAYGREIDALRVGSEYHDADLMVCFIAPRVPSN